MVEIIYYVASSLDGYIATLDGGIEWLPPIESGGEDYGYQDFYASVETVLVGRRTYEQILSFSSWPYPDKPCWVFTKYNHLSAQPGLTLTSKEPTQVVRELEKQNVQRAWLVGGGLLAGSFFDSGLISELIVSIIPTVLGAGIPLLGRPTSHQLPLKLLSSIPYPNGIVQLHYRLVH